jgi:carboxypeptidase T
VKNQVLRVFSMVLLAVLLTSSLSAMGTSVAAGKALPLAPEKASLAVAALPEGDGPWVVRAYYTDRRMVDELAAWLEPWEVHPDKGYLVVAVTRDEYNRLLDAGFGLEVDAQLTEEVTRPHVALPGQVTAIPGYPCYRTVEETYATAQAIVTAHPDLASWTSVGLSWERTQPGGSPGYDMMVLRLTNSAVPGPKPKFFAMGGIHAREYATAELATRFAEYLVDNYGVDPDVTWLLDYHEVHLMLQSNPDGRKIAETGTLWRKNTDNDDGCSTPSSWGTDLNRNFEFQWGCCGGSSGSPCAETYRGPGAGSEPETQAVQNYIVAQFPDQREDPLTAPAPVTATGVFLDIHSYSQLVLWPWGFTYSTAPNSTALQTLGRKFAYFNHYTPDQSVGLYPTDGTTDDFAYGERGVAAYTFEIGTSFFQDCPTFENVILPDNLPALLYAAKVVRTPYLTPAGPDALDVVATPGGVAPGDAVHLTATVNDTRYNNSNGTEPTQNIAAAEYYIDVPPWVTSPTPVAYPMTAVDGTFNQKIEAVEATLDTTGLGNGRHTIFVRGQDVAGNWGAFSAVFVYIVEPGVAPVIDGYVRDAGDNHPLDATVTAGTFQAQTDPATGFYSMTVISDTYDITASAGGHAPATVTGVQAHDYETVHQDFSLFAVCDAFADDVESGNQGWTAQGSWAITNEASHSFSHSWTDSPGGNYGNYWNYSLTSPVLDLSDYQGLTLDFWHIYDLEPGWDYGYVEYSANGGSWTSVASYTGYGHTTWTREVIPLPALGGVANARIRFRITTDSNTVANGWHIDDIVLSGGGPACVTAFPPVAEFVSDSPVGLGSPMQFTNQTTGTQPIDYLWDFGDNQGTSTETDPGYTYLAAGTFTVTLTATNTVGSDSVSHPVVVLPASCVEVTGVQLSLVTTGTLYTGTPAEFSADILPDDATKPYTYTISAGLPLTGTADPLGFSLTFGTAGTHTVAIDVWNCALTVPVTSSAEVLVLPLHHLYLPIIIKP